MNPEHTWHVPADRLARYGNGMTVPVERDSIEAHLLACSLCRTDLAGARSGSTSSHEAMLGAITDRIDRPRRNFRWSNAAVQASLASPPLVVASALLAATLVLSVGIADSIRPSAGLAVLVAVAPLTPIVAAVAAFWPTTDPAGTLSIATPLAGGRLPFLRAMYATAVSAGAALISSMFTPLGWADSILWLAPGFAFAAITIAAATWINPLRLAAGLAAGWGVVCTQWIRGHRSLGVIDAVNHLGTHGEQIQLACIVLMSLASIVALLRRDAQPNWRTA